MLELKLFSRQTCASVAILRAGDAQRSMRLTTESRRVLTVPSAMQGHQPRRLSPLPQRPPALPFSSLRMLLLVKPSLAFLHGVRVLLRAFIQLSHVLLYCVVNTWAHAPESRRLGTPAGNYLTLRVCPDDDRAQNEP